MEDHPNLLQNEEGLMAPSHQHRNSSSPTRTLHITAAEQSLRERQASPRPLTLESLSLRPRSNPRSRTPRRYESPIDPQEFRRSSLGSEADVSASPSQQRITIRPLAGSAVGVTLATRIREERPATPKSRKQGPSHRKVRRWNNEHFSGLAAEIKASRGSAAAHALLEAQKDAHLYRQVYNPDDLRSEKMSRFFKDDEFKKVREQFFEGELPVSSTVNGVLRSKIPSNKRGFLTAEDMMNRIDTRLRSVVVKACSNSYPAAKVVKTFESFIISSFNGTNLPASLGESWWKDLLLEKPIINNRKDSGEISSITTIQFFFDAESSTGGFHRLLLHAVAQFHGLYATSRMSETSTAKRARALTVRGNHSSEPSRYLLIDHIAKIDRKQSNKTQK